MNKKMYYQVLYKNSPKIMKNCHLTEVAGEGGSDLAPQKFLLSQKFRHLMRCKKYLKIFFYLA